MHERPRSLVIDARPRGPDGPWAGTRLRGRPVLAHLVELAETLGAKPVVVHATDESRAELQSLVEPRPSGTGAVVWRTGAPPEDAVVLRTDRLYERSRLRRLVRRGLDPEQAVVWRLDGPHGLVGAEQEWTRRQSYQPWGRYWAWPLARSLARWLSPTPVRPNALTLASGALMVAASVLVAFGSNSIPIRVATALAMALALVLDTADGHLARRQGTASDFGRWLDAFLDELGDMALHAAIAWAAFVREGQPLWLVVGMVYVSSKYLFVGMGVWGSESGDRPPEPDSLPSRSSVVRSLVHLAGHADVRWHLWIVLAALGRLDLALVSYATYFAVRVPVAVARKAVRHAR